MFIDGVKYEKTDLIVPNSFASNTAHFTSSAFTGTKKTSIFKVYENLTEAEIIAL